MGERSFFSELKRRNVLRAATLYAAGAWLLVQVATQVSPFFDISNWVVRWIVVAAAIGFPFAMVLSWFYELTPEGFKRDEEVAPDASIAPRTGKRLDRAIIGVLAMIIVLLVADIVVPHRDREATTAAALDKSIAVLPFIDLSPGHDQAYFSDGMSEEILNALAQVDDLKVAGRTSSFYFKGKDQDLRAIGKALGVANILEGSVRKQGDKVRITAQLIRAADDTHLWSHEYDGDLGDVFKLQEDIARAITDQLKVVLVGAQKQALARETTKSTEAHQQYLRGQYFWHQRGFANLQQAVTSFKAAIAADPDYADAWASMAQVWAVLPEYSNTSAPDAALPPDTARLALDAAGHALRLDPHSNAALLARAYVHGVDQFDWAGAESDFRTVLASTPRDATAHLWFGEILLYQRRFAEADAQFAVALDIDRFWPVAQHLRGYSLAMQGKPAQALPFFDEAVRLEPGFFFAQRWRVLSLARLGRYDEALAAASDLPASSQAETREFVGALRDPSKHDAAARSILARATAAGLLTPVEPVELSMLGHDDLAMTVIERMFEAKAPNRAYLYADVQLDALHADPRFQAVMREANLPPASAGTKAAGP